MLVVFVAAHVMLRQLPPVMRRFAIIDEMPTLKKTRPTLMIDQILHNDPFGTVAPPAPKSSAVKSLVTPIPEFSEPEIPPMPEIKKPEIQPALQLTLNGIVASANEGASIALIADETGKENIYHVGDKIKDACLIRIAPTRVVFLRSNGQQELFYLRKEEQLMAQSEEASWQYVVKKIDDNQVQIDRRNFSNMFPSLGDLFEKFGAVPAISRSKPLGIKITQLPSEEMAEALCVKKNDIITSVNKIPATTNKGRMKIYDYLTSIKDNESFDIEIKRKKEKLVLSVTTKTIAKPNKWAFLLSGKKDEEDEEDDSNTKKKGPEQFNKPNDFQMREKERTEFEVNHMQDFQQAIFEIRRRLMENMKTRGNDTRIR